MAQTPPAAGLQSHGAHVAGGATISSKRSSCIDHPAGQLGTVLPAGPIQKATGPFQPWGGAATQSNPAQSSSLQSARPSPSSSVPSVQFSPVSEPPAPPGPAPPVVLVVPSNSM